MRLSIFYRLNLGYLVIILVMGTVIAYSVLKLQELNKETTRIFSVDERLLTLKSKLADSILSQLEYEKKYSITKDAVFRDQSATARKDFSTYFKEAAILADTSLTKASLETIWSSYQRYQSSADATMSGTVTTQGLADSKNEKIVEEILTELKKIENDTSQNISMRMGELSVATGNAHRFAVLMFVVAVVFVIIISVTITRRITSPLKELIYKTDEISRGLFEGNLNISSPPEIAELAKAVNIMCDKLKEVDTMKTDFFSTMSHELRTPLASIKEGISLLHGSDAESNTAKRERLVSILSEETNRLIDMVNRLLDLSKMEAGMMPYHFNREDLVPLIEQAIMEITPLTETKKLRVVKTIDKDLPRVNLDRERILQALRNLIGNAIKFCRDEGQITVTVRKKGETIECLIHDTGPGIPAESLNKIFEKFHQSSLKPSDWKGTGLGLALVKHIIKAHGGNVWAESEIGQGSTFTFALPV